MSKTVDERVVSMQFDNKSFESNVSTTMSTLDKLKQSLKFEGASKGLQDISDSARKVDIGALGNAVETVQAKFSALQVMGITALTNITNSAVNAGKRIISALTIDPVKTGFNEYETQINSTQTILANVKHKGKTLEDVTHALDELNTYADQTIYNFTEMTKNIGLFVNAGVGLDESVAAIKGFSNAAAMAGVDATKTAAATYQLSQAMSSGKVLLMDWRSLETSNIAGERFKETIIETAKAHNINVDAMIKKEGSFRDTLKSGWLTADLMSEALNHYTLSTKTMTAAEQEANKERLRSMGYTDEQIKKLFEIGTEATAAATEVKTLSQMWGVMKETAQSGWAKTWKLIVGDFDQAKALFTPLTNFFSDIIQGMANVRNTIVEGAMNNPFTNLINKISDITANVKTGVDALTNYEEIVNRVIRGDFGNQGDNGDPQYRQKKLTEAGYDYATVQTLVNEKLGVNVKLTDDLDASQEELTKTQAKNIDQLAEMSDAQLKEAGYTEEQIEAIKELAKYADAAGMSLSEFIKSMEGKKDGRTMLIESFSRIGKSIASICGSIREAWLEIFPPEELAMKIYGLISKFHEFSENLVLSDETADRLKRTFKGLFTIIDMVSTIVAGPVKMAFKILAKLFGMYDLDLLEITAKMGDAIVKFWDTVDVTKYFAEALAWLMPHITKAVTAFKDWIAGLKNSENLPKDIANGIVNGLGKAFEFVKEIIVKIKEYIVGGFADAPDDMTAGFVGGIKGGITTALQTIAELAKAILAKFREVMGIHSPSTETKDDGKNFILGFIEGLGEFAKKAWEFIKGFASKCIEIFGGFDFGSIFAAMIGVGMLVLAFKVVSAIRSMLKPLEGFGEVLESVSGVAKAFATELRAEALKSIAVAIAILVASIAVLTLLDTKKMLIAAGVVLALVGALWLVMDKIDGMGKGAAEDGTKNALKIAGVLFALAAAMGVMAIVIKVVSGMEWAELGKAAVGLAAVGGIIIALVAATKLAGKDIDDIGNTILKIGLAMLMLTVVAKIIAGMTWDEMAKAAVGIAGLVGVIIALTWIIKHIGDDKELDGVCKTLLAISTSIAILALVAKLIASMTWDEMTKATVGLAGLFALIAGLIYITQLVTEKDLDGLARVLLSISVCMAVLALVAKLIATMSWGEMLKAAVGLAGLAGLVAGLIAMTKLASDKDLTSLALVLLAMSASIAILAGVTILLGYLDPNKVGQGLIAVGILTAFIAGLMYVSKFAQECTGTLIAIGVVVALLAASLVAMSAVDSTKLVVATGAMAVLMGMIAALMALTSKVSKDALGPLIVLSVMVAIFGAVLFALGMLKPESVIGSAIGLSILIGVLTGILILLSKVKVPIKDVLLGMASLLLMAIPLAALVGVLLLMNGVQNATQNAIILSAFAAAMSILALLLSGVGAIVMSTGGGALLGILALLLMAIPLIALVGVLAAMQNVENAAKNAVILTAFCTALTLLLIPLSIIGLVVLASCGASLLGIAALLLMAIPLIALVGVLAVMQNVQNATSNTMLLIDLMTVLTDMLVKVSIVAPLAVMGVAAMAALTALIVAIGALAIAVGVLFDKFPQLEEFINTGAPILVKLAGVVGEIIGSFISNLISSSLSFLPEIGTLMSQFMTNVTPFIEGARMVDGAVLAGVGILSAAIIALTVADLINGIASFIQNGSTLAELGADLSQFMINAMPFVLGAQMIKPALLNSVKSLTGVILTLTAANVLEGLTSWFTGGSSLSKFGAELGGFGTNLNQFITNLGTFDDARMATVKAACNAITILAKAAGEIPNDGGLWGALAGENSLASFSSKLPNLGTHIKLFVDNLGSFDESSLTKVKNAGGAMSELAKAAKALPKEDGFWQALVGSNSLSAFGAQLPPLALHMKNFILGLGTFDDTSVKTATCACNVIKALASAAKSLPKEDGFWQSLFGSNSLATFGAQLPGLATNIVKFISNLGTVDEEQIKSVNNACKILNAFAGLGKADFKALSKNLPDFSEELIEVATGLKSFVTSMNGISADEVASAIEKTNDLVTLAKSVVKVDSKKLEAFGDSLKEVATDGINGFIKSFTSDSPKKQIVNAAETLIDTFIKGVGDKKEDTNKAFTTVAETAAKELTSETLTDKFTQAGKDLTSGFASGITAKKQAAVDAASAVGYACLDAIKAALDSHSPSKETYKLGGYAGDGFVNALDDYTSRSYDAGYDMANAAKQGLRSAVNRLGNMIDMDIDSQPTIQPVLDLSEIRAGANDIVRMLDLQTSVGVVPNVRAINSTMNSRHQNGANDDVVDAIGKLRNDLGKVGNTSYNINGVTYGADSEVASAIETLVRAMRIEERR